MPSQPSRSYSNDDSQSSETNTVKLSVDATEVDKASDEEKDATKDMSNERAMTFPLKLMSILSNEEHEKIVAWLPSGEGFCIFNKTEFTDSVLPRYFKKSKFASFTRKLHRWQFVRVSKGPKLGTYHHPLFKRDKVELCMKMSCLPQVKNIKDAQQLPSLSPFTQVLPFGQRLPQQVEGMHMMNLSEPRALMSMMAQSQESRTNLMYHNELLKQQHEHLVHLWNLKQQSQLNTVLQQQRSQMLHNSLNSSMILSTQQPIFPHQLPLNINSSNLSMRRTNALDLGNDLSSPTMSPKSEIMSTLQNKIARIEHEIISLREARYKQLSSKIQSEGKAQTASFARARHRVNSPSRRSNKKSPAAA